MIELTLSLDDHLLAESKEYARRRGMTLDELVRDLLRQTIKRKPGAAFAAMIEEADARGLCSVDVPLSREEANER